MNNYALLDIKYLRARVVNNFAIDFSDWKIRAIEWLAECIGLMDIDIELQDWTETITIANNESRLPCSIKLLRYIETDGKRLVKNKNDNYRGTLNKDYAYSEHGYSINSGGYLWFPTIESGTANVYFKRLPLSDAGYPMIPDNEMVLEAASWFILMRMIGSGYDHPTHKSYKEIEDKVMGVGNRFNLFVKARNSIGSPDSDHRELISQAIRGVIHRQDDYDTTTFITT